MTAEKDDIERLLRVPSVAHRHILGWLFIVLAVIVVAAIAFRESTLLREYTGLELITYFRQGHSLHAGSKVLLAEVQIGEIQSVKLLHDPRADTDRIHVEVRMQIKGEYGRTLPQGTRAEIRFGALEFANSVVLVPPDTPTDRMLSSGATIPASEGTDILEEAKVTFAQVSRDLLSIVANFKTLSDNLSDTTGEYRRIVNNLTSSTNNAEQILSRSRDAFESRRSVAGVLMNENIDAARDVRHTMSSANRTAIRIETMTDTFTVIAGNMRRASGRMPSLMNQADSTLVAVEDLANKVGSSWWFRSRADSAKNQEAGAAPISKGNRY